MKTLHVALAALMTVSVPTLVRADREDRIRVDLAGFQEVPSVSTPASGRLKVNIARDDQSFDYELTFGGLIGTVQQSHIHFAQRGVNGSVVVWLCQTATTQAPAEVRAITPVCPQSGTVTGTITTANVITATLNNGSQQILAGELAEVLAAMRAGYAYANVHATPLNPGGEIRGQFPKSEHHDDKR